MNINVSFPSWMILVAVDVICLLVCVWIARTGKGGWIDMSGFFIAPVLLFAIAFTVAWFVRGCVP